MPSLNIKTRVLLFVILFEVLAYSSIVLFNNYFYTEELSALKKQEISKIFESKMERIDNSILLMEQSAFNLAQHGASLYLQQQNEKLPPNILKQRFNQVLTNHFKYFTHALGGGLWYEPSSIISDEQYFGPYVYREQNKVIFSWDLSTPEYDYHTQDWYRLGKQAANFRQHTVWTEPYIDEAGSFAPMMTVDSPIYNQQQHFVGMATVDWSLFELTQLLSKVKITKNSWPFLIHKTSNMLISFPFDKNLVMKPLTNVHWAQQAIDNSMKGRLNIARNVSLNGIAFDMYFVETQSGFIFGSFSPHTDITNDVREISIVTLVGGALIGSLFIIVMFVLLKYLFYPFDLVLKLIKKSIVHKASGKISVHQITYTEENEFTPIVDELNLVYEQVIDYIKTIKESNNILHQSKSQIDQLNSELEEKVKLRTAELNLKTQEALDALNSLKSMQSQMIEQEKHASLGRLVAGIAHEINTPLGISITASSHLEDQTSAILAKAETNTLTKIEFDTYLMSMSESCFILKNNLNRTAELVSSFKQISVDQVSEQKRNVELNQYLQDIIRTLEPKFSNSPHQINFNAFDKDILINCYPGAIAQIVTNIVDNALIHAFSADKQGEIIVSVKLQANVVFIKISDNGIGMPAEVLQNIFDPFFTTNREKGGCGLGMHLVYNIVTQQLKGEIRCSSEFSVGTQFSISFPIG